jgi:hypothetical protein
MRRSEFYADRNSETQILGTDVNTIITIMHRGDLRLITCQILRVSTGFQDSFVPIACIVN